jgi:hypothetical protein
MCNSAHSVGAAGPGIPGCCRIRAAVTAGIMPLLQRECYRRDPFCWSAKTCGDNLQRLVLLRSTLHAIQTLPASAETSRDLSSEAARHLMALQWPCRTRTPVNMQQFTAVVCKQLNFVSGQLPNTVDVMHSQHGGTILLISHLTVHCSTLL